MKEQAQGNPKSAVGRTRPLASTKLQALVTRGISSAGLAPRLRKRRFRAWMVLAVGIGKCHNKEVTLLEGTLSVGR